MNWYKIAQSFRVQEIASSFKDFARQQGFLVQTGDIKTDFDKNIYLYLHPRNLMTYNDAIILIRQFSEQNRDNFEIQISGRAISRGIPILKLSINDYHS